MSITGGCQCGALRYRLERFGRASICHCRMCQKAMGNYFAPLVVAEGFEWTRGEPGRFASSNLSNRGFCSRCGTPITLETDDAVELCIGTLDDPSAVQVQYHSNPEDRLDYVMRLEEIPEANLEQETENTDWNAQIVSHQHPDYETQSWEAKR